MNSSDGFQNSSRPFTWPPVYRILKITTQFSEYFFLSFGVLLNLWVLLAVLKCKDIRSRMRRRVVCSFSLLHLLYDLVFLPMMADGFSLNCHFYSALVHIHLMQDFISNWTLVLLMVNFVSQVCDYKPPAGFTQLATNIGAYTLLVLPWVASLITIPAVTRSTFYTYLKNQNISNYGSCIVPIFETSRVIRWLDTTAPLLVAGALLVTAVVLRRRRFTRGVAKGMQIDLIDPGPHIDDHHGYTAAFVVTLVCDLPFFFSIIQTFTMNIEERAIFSFTALFLSMAKCVFGPLAWIFFPDIRERLKTWRPWYSPKPGIDLTVVYKNTTQ